MSDQKIIEVDAEFAKEVAKALTPTIAEAVKVTVEEATKAQIEATEKTINKGVQGSETAEIEATQRVLRKKLGDMPKEVAFLKAAHALTKGDKSIVAEYNETSLEARRKAGYGNETTGADGGFLVPDPDFDAAVERMEEEYGVAVRYADVRRINSNSVKLNKKDTGFELVETNEAQAKTGLKFTIDQVDASLRKFAGIVPATDELIEDSAVDYWAEVTREFARANARKQDELVFTDATSGLLEISGTAFETVGSSILDITWDDLLNAEVKVPSMSAGRGAHFMHRSVWNKLVQSKGTSNDHYMFQPNPNGATTPWGTPVVLTEVLPGTAADADNKAFAVFGDLSYVKLYIKNGLVLTALSEATVKDADGNDINLALQDMSALRGVVRMLAVAKFADAFAVVGTGTVS